MPGERLKRWLKWSGWTQERLAAECGGGTHQATISKVVHGREPSVAIAVTIERVTSEPRDDGATWDEPPILAREWVAPSSTEAA